MLQVTLGKRRLAEDALLHEHQAMPYQVNFQDKKQRKDGAQCHVVICTDEGVIEAKLAAGALVGQVLVHAGLPAWTQVREAATQAAVSLAARFYGKHIWDARLLSDRVCESDESSDQGIERFLDALKHVLPPGQAVLKPRAASLLCYLGGATRTDLLAGVQVVAADRLHVVAEAHGHWFLLSLDFEKGEAVHWDPFPMRTIEAAKLLSAVLCRITGNPSLSIVQDSVPTLGQQCCGAIALGHLLLAGGLLPGGSLQLTNWIQARVHELSVGPALHYGTGGLGHEARQQLSDILRSKGVPDAKIQERIADAVSRLGPAKIEDSLKASRPWAVLKAVATGLPQPFRWLKADELEQQIRQKADNKFGTAAAEARHKKKAGKGTKSQPIPQLDPRSLVLVEGSFVTEDGTAVPSLSLE